MKEIIIKNNNTGLRVYINDKPKLELIPEAEAESVVAALELQIAERYKKAKAPVKKQKLIL